MKLLSRRLILALGTGSALAGLIGLTTYRKSAMANTKTAPFKLTEKQWKERLTAAQFNVLRKEGTERAFTSPLNKEKRSGIYHCAGCDLPLFDAKTKYDSGTGWPSFYDVLPKAVDTKADYWIGYKRTEYHCARCGGHQGHVFNDGPKPTGLRYCNNGVALTFKPKAENS